MIEIQIVTKRKMINFVWYEGVCVSVCVYIYISLSVCVCVCVCISLCVFTPVIIVDSPQDALAEPMDM